MKQTVKLLTAVGVGCCLGITGAARAEPAGAAPVFAKFIRIEHRSDDPKIGMELAEVEVISGMRQHSAIQPMVGRRLWSGISD